MDEETLDKYVKAGQIAAQAREYGRGLVKADAKIIDVARAIEKKITELGGIPAFPVNISFDETAAHDTAGPNDERSFGERLIKLDVGVHVDGFVGGDTAITIDLSRKYTELVKASQEALEAAIKTVQIGATCGEIGKAIEETIMGFGLKPVRNLSGHGIGENLIHGSPSIPNYDNKDQTQLSDGMTIAIEPFATDGMGLIHEKGQALIHSQVLRKPVRNAITRQVITQIEGYRGMPFATRWLSEKIPLFKVNYALKELNQLGMLHSYPPLVERGNGMVSQAEHSIYVGDKVKILTKL
ncbi:TPA: type II methionyl aminopeptidase [Candidatus Woesearchaeota archaeon]|nr:type II methionyl aminopeptidase [Candidatus Woesearchaeota archaeon]